MVRPRSKGRGGEVFVRVLSVQGKGKKLMLTIPKKTVEALDVHPKDEIWVFHHVRRGRIIFELRRE